MLSKLRKLSRLPQNKETQKNIDPPLEISNIAGRMRDDNYIENNDDNYFNSLVQCLPASPVKQGLVIHLHPRTPLAKSRAKKVLNGRPIKKAKGPVTLCLIGKKDKYNLSKDLNDCVK